LKSQEAVLRPDAEYRYSCDVTRTLVPRYKYRKGTRASGQNNSGVAGFVAAWLSKMFLPETESPVGRKSLAGAPAGVGLRPEAKPRVLGAEEVRLHLEFLHRIDRGCPFEVRDT